MSRNKGVGEVNVFYDMMSYRRCQAAGNADLGKRNCRSRRLVRFRASGSLRAAEGTICREEKQPKTALWGRPACRTRGTGRRRWEGG